MAGSGQCDGRHANRRGFPGLAPPRCHPGPPSLSLSESSSPARECAQGRGARGEVARPARAAILPPPPPAAAAGRALPKGRGEGDRRGCRGHRGRTESSTQRPGWRAAAAKSEHPAGRSCGRRRCWWPALPPHGAARLGTCGATECARSARAKLAAAAPPRRLLPPLSAQRSPLLAGPTPPSSDSSLVPPGCSPAAV